VAVVLWHIPISHYNEKVRWALDYKRIPYELRAPMPGMHRLTAMRLTRSAHDRLPVIGIDGERIGDSTAIIAALEQRWPEPALYPADPAERERALALEDYFDEELAPRVRRLFWFHTLDDPQLATAAALGGSEGVRAKLMLRTAPLGAKMVRRDYSVDEAGAADAVEGIRTAMDRVESELGGRDYLVGDRFSVADLAAAALFTPLVSPPERPFSPELVPSLQEICAELEARPGGAFVTEMYARHRGAPVPVA
jgi:glutathione S-transferase